MEHVVILITILLISPFVLKVASSQNKHSKHKLRVTFLCILALQLVLGFLNWENFNIGRSGFELSLSYPNSYLELFFIFSIIQIILLLLNESFNRIVVILNFVNSILIFAALINLSSTLGFQAVSFASIGVVFLILIGNVIGLVFINKDRNLLKKYYHQRGFTLTPVLVVTIIAIIGAVIYFQKTPLEELIPEQIIPSTTGMTKNQAIENVKKLPEVQEYLKNVPNGKVEVDNESEGEYNVHVYEVKNGHTATYNWYYVSIKSGEIRREFETEDSNEVKQQTTEENPEQQQVQSSKMPTGIVSGKVCYPSEVIPKGKLEVKRLLDGYIIYEDYPGSIAGVKPTYSFQLGPGDYYIRYNVDDKLFGYSTTVCPTGSETTCADTKKRVPVTAVVKEDQTLKNYDLCDYYYKDSNAPKF